MKSKLNFLIEMSLKRKINTKWFKIVNIILLVAIVALANIDSIINAFGGDFDKKQEIYIIDNTDVSYDLFKQQLMLITKAEKEEDMNYLLNNYEGTIEDAKKELENEEKRDNLYIVFDNDEEKVLSVKLISYEYMDILDSQFISNSIYNTKVMLAISKSNISPEEINNIYSNIDVERIIIDDTKTSKDESMEVVMTSVFPLVILPFFMLIIFLVQMIGSEINDEKATRGMEIIISSVSPTKHFFSKIIATNLFIILQAVLLFIYGALGMFIRHLIGGDNITNGVFGSVGSMLKEALATSFIDKLIYIIPLTLILMLLTFLAYSLLAGILASMTTNVEDFQNLQTPIVIILLTSYYLAMLASTFEGALFIKVLSYIPLISAILSPSLLVLGQIGVFDVCISIVLMIGCIYLLIKYGLRIYKVGILNYSSTGLWQKMLKAMKK
ncbi:MAG: ABC transporter permease [Bacilli bacterium]|nr:ABC transporter permease [Bacilli bacterium]